MTANWENVEGFINKADLAALRARNERLQSIIRVIMLLCDLPEDKKKQFEDAIAKIEGAYE